MASRILRSQSQVCRSRLIATATVAVATALNSTVCTAEDKPSPPLVKQLAKLELQIVGSAPAHESCQRRLQNIEVKLFGQEQSGALLDRLSKIMDKVKATEPGANDSSATRNKLGPDGWPAFSVTPSTDTADVGPTGQSTTASPSVTTTTVTSSSTSTSGGANGPSPSPESILASHAQSSSSSVSATTMASASSSAPASAPASASMPITAASTSVTGVTSSAIPPATEQPAQSRIAAMLPPATTGDGWPAFLPRFTAPAPAAKAHAPLKAELTESVSKNEAIVASLKHAPDKDLFKRATDELDGRNYKLAKQLFMILSARKPKEPRYFFGAGMAARGEGDTGSSFANFVLAWHLGDSRSYAQWANLTVNELKSEVDPAFKLTYGWNRTDPEVALNAGARCWKAGLTSEAVQLFEYALKNEPLCRGTAAYNLGAIAEYGGDNKLAHQYYAWAEKENARLAAEAVKSPAYAGEIEKSLNVLPQGYIAQAAADTENKLLSGNVRQWNGWAPATVLPAGGVSEICPICGISRTKTTLNY